VCLAGVLDDPEALAIGQGPEAIAHLLQAAEPGHRPPDSVPGGAPTGQVFNPTSGFRVDAAGTSTPAFFIFDSEAGVISVTIGRR